MLVEMRWPSVTNPRGTKWTSDVVNFLIPNGFPLAERRAQFGSKDRADVTGIGPDWAMECKDEARISLAAYMAETEAERINAGAKYGVAVVKRRGKNVRHAYAVMELWNFAELMREREESKEIVIKIPAHWTPEQAERFRCAWNDACEEAA